MAHALGTMDDDESDAKPKKRKKVGSKKNDPKGSSNVIRLRAPKGNGKDAAGLSDDLGVDYDLYDESDTGGAGGDGGEDAVYLESDEEPIFQD